MSENNNNNNSSKEDKREDSSTSGGNRNGNDGIFSSSSSIMDYVTLPGIRNRVGVDTEPDLITYVVKEILDNALEFIERNASKRKSVSVKPYIDVSVTKAPMDNYVTIIIRNSNFGISNSSFSSKDVLKSVFDYGKFYSSKRNQFKIGRGALGDALKIVGGIPHALAYQYNVEDKWNEPAVIVRNSCSSSVSDTKNKKCFVVMLQVDRIRQSINTIVKEEKQQHEQQLFFKEEGKGRGGEQDCTEIEIRIPFFTFHSLDSLKWLLEQYVFINTHVGFRCTIQPDLISSERNENFSINVPPHQEISMSKWANLSSVYFYSFAEFKNFILNLEDDSMTFYDLVKRTFREGTNLTPKKDPSLMISIGQLKTNHKAVMNLFESLRSVMKPSTTNFKVQIPFKVSSSTNERKN